jgi:archaellum component FlaF (FlaF/FlaG flagellin family)
MEMGRIWILAVLLIALPLVSAYDHILINSQDWRDVYTGTQYANLVGTSSHFLVSTKHSTIVLYSIPTSEENILVLTNKDRPFIVGYPDILRSRGYTRPEEIRSANINLELLKRVNATRFIVLDDAYGYNAISVAPFSQVDKSFVIFANRNNIDDIVPVLQAKNPAKVLIYGQVDREVKDALAPFNPETINKGNRFDNNIEITQRYMKIKPTKQVILTNGEFIESGVMSGADPVVFLGRQNVPDSVRTFIREGDVEVGILIGNELVNSATFVRRQLGISVFVKFAQGSRQPTGAISTVEDLDRFPMPGYDLGIEVSSVVYNKATGSLQVTYHNTVGQAEYFKSTITIHDGTAVKVTGDKNSTFLDKAEYKTVLYTGDVDGNPLNLQSSEIGADLFTIFGEGPSSLENIYQKSFQTDIIDVLDDSQVNITGVYYDKLAKKMYVRVKNTGKVDAYVNAELVDLVINGQAVTVGSDGIVKLAKGDTADLLVNQELADADIADNPTIKTRAYYGEREMSRIKIIEGTFSLQQYSGYERYAIWGAVILVVLLLLFFLGTKKKCGKCGHPNARGRKLCEKCGERF